MHVSERSLRRSPRRVPTHPILVSVEAERAHTTGEAVNLSDGGACLALDDSAFQVGDELILWMHLAQPRHAVPATGRVVWTAPDPGRPRCGLEWTHRGPQREWISWVGES
jgi:hypothetical protein